MKHNEQLLQYLWKYKLYPASSLVTTDGHVVEVIDPGMQNRDAGPDFFNAKIKIGGQLWAGNVEIHLSSSDGYSMATTETSVTIRLFSTWPKR